MMSGIEQLTQSQIVTYNKCDNYTRNWSSTHMIKSEIQIVLESR